MIEFGSIYKNTDEFNLDEIKNNLSKTGRCDAISYNIKTEISLLRQTIDKLKPGQIFSFTLNIEDHFAFCLAKKEKNKNTDVYIFNGSQKMKNLCKTAIKKINDKIVIHEQDIGRQKFNTSSEIAQFLLYQYNSIIKYKKVNNDILSSISQLLTQVLIIPGLTEGNYNLSKIIENLENNGKEFNSSAFYPFIYRKIHQNTNPQIKNIEELRKKYQIFERELGKSIAAIEMTAEKPIDISDIEIEEPMDKTSNTNTHRQKRKLNDSAQTIPSKQNPTNPEEESAKNTPTTSASADNADTKLAKEQKQDPQDITTRSVVDLAISKINRITDSAESDLGQQIFNVFNFAKQNGSIDLENKDKVDLLRDSNYLTAINGYIQNKIVKLIEKILKLTTNDNELTKQTNSLLVSLENFNQLSNHIADMNKAEINPAEKISKATTANNKEYHANRNSSHVSHTDETRSNSNQQDTAPDLDSLISKINRITESAESDPGQQIFNVFNLAKQNGCIDLENKDKVDLLRDSNYLTAIHEYIKNELIQSIQNNLNSIPKNSGFDKQIYTLFDGIKNLNLLLNYLDIKNINKQITPQY